MHCLKLLRLTIGRFVSLAVIHRNIILMAAFPESGHSNHQ